MDRYKTIDAFRGIAILGMIFFTVTLRLSSDLPDLLRHNVWGRLHLGDFILPMFLFASGLSLAFFIKKREKLKTSEFFKDVFIRFIKLGLIGILLSFFSAYGFLEMDEVMLCAILFIMCIIINKLDWKILMVIILLINISYLIIIHLGWDDIFIGHYLGGYPAALYYLPIMLTGLIIGKGIILKGLWCKTNKIAIALIFVLFLVFSIFVPINKMTASSSFILFSIIFSFGFFVFIEWILNDLDLFKKLEYIGRKPLRYWILMYIFFIIPLWFYIRETGESIPLQINWIVGTIFSLFLIILLLIMSYIIEYIKIKYKTFNHSQLLF